MHQPIGDIADGSPARYGWARRAHHPETFTSTPYLLVEADNVAFRRALGFEGRPERHKHVGAVDHHVAALSTASRKFVRVGRGRRALQVRCEPPVTAFGWLGPACWVWLRP